ncbi:O-antigen ligase, partial [Devosia sp.]|uniref:O-antigen ligase family protein n=1 Tax=Devosia sp. TaxID=1871048 RepID=UPI0027325BCC
MRLQIWRDSVRAIRAQPVLGVGPGHYGLVLPAHRTSQGLREWRQLMGPRRNVPYHAHNEFLETWVDTGIVGLAGLVGLLGAALWVGVRAGRQSPEADAAPAA